MVKISDIIILCFVLVFFQGVAVLSGAPRLEYQLIIDILVLLLFIHAAIVSRSLRAFPAILLFLLFTVVWILSTVYFKSDMFTAYRFYRNTLIPYLFFIAVLNLPLSENSFLKINRFIFILLFVQILAAVVKYIVFGGVHEGTIIGTFDDTGSGQYSTIFPLLAIIFLLSFYLIYSRKCIYLLFMAGFLFMAWGGGKRAFVFVFPVFILIFYYYYNKFEQKKPILTKKNLLYVCKILILIIPLFYVFVRFTPSLNPEYKYGGSFDIEHVYNYVSFYYLDEHYDVDERYGGQAMLLGRKATTVRALELTTSGIEHFLMGYGPSSLYASSRGDPRLLKFGVVAFQTGFAYFIMSIGFPGSIVLVLIYLRIGALCIKNFRFFDEYWRAIKLGVFCSLFVILFDYFIYSPVFVKGFVTNMCFFYLAASAIKQEKSIIADSKT